MIRYLRTRLEQGLRTANYPAEAPVFPERFRGRPVLDASRCTDCAGCAARMPTGLLLPQPGGGARLDAGAALYAPEEAAACPHGALSFTSDHRLASSTREGLCSEAGEIELAQALDQRARAMFGRSLRLRSVAAGSCNGCEAELVVLGTAVFDMARFGIQFVASPRHADGIVVTGAVSVNMRDAVYRTYEATPEPRLVIAVCAAVHWFVPRPPF